jgi:hypothetical protein
LQYSKTKYEEERKLKEEVESKLTELDSNLAVIKDEKEVLIKDTVKKGVAIADLTVETKEKELAIQEEKEKVKRQRQWMVYIAAFFMVVSIFSFLLFRLYREKKKSQSIIDFAERGNYRTKRRN